LQVAQIFKFEFHIRPTKHEDAKIRIKSSL